MKVDAHGWPALDKKAEVIEDPCWTPCYFLFYDKLTNLKKKQQRDCDTYVDLVINVV